MVIVWGPFETGGVDSFLQWCGIASLNADRFPFVFGAAFCSTWISLTAETLPIHTFIMPFLCLLIRCTTLCFFLHGAGGFLPAWTSHKTPPTPCSCVGFSLIYSSRLILCPLKKSINGFIFSLKMLVKLRPARSSLKMAWGRAYPS